MDTNKPKFSLKDLFLNLGAIVALYVVVGSLVNLLFTVINRAYPQVTGYNYYTSSTISWPVAAMIVLFPIFILLMRVLEKDYDREPERRNYGIHRWLTYITLFLSGGILVGDLITILYYFIDGRELTLGFVLKIVTLFVIAGGLFLYYISDLRGKLTGSSRNVWRIASTVIIIGSIVWGFSVLGSPRTQRLYKFDEQKINDLMNISDAVRNYYSTKGVLPKDFAELSTLNYYMNQTDTQNNKPYEYTPIDRINFKVCADFNKESVDDKNQKMTYPYGGTSWTHPAGRHCFEQVAGPTKMPPVTEVFVR